MSIWTLAAAAFASPCPDVPAQVQVAWDAYQEAELERAKGLLASAYDSLACQRAVVPPEALLELYRLDALVSLTQEDRKGAVYATIRAVAVDPDDEPPASYGPELAELYALWSVRLAETLVTVSVADGGAAWVDGRRVDRATPARVVQGEHLVQLEAVDGVVSEVRELAVDTALTTGIPLDAALAPEPVAGPPPVPVAGERARRRPVGLIVGGAVSGALGAVALASGWRGEQAFLGTAYDARTYGGCQQGEGCWTKHRADTIASDAARIRAMYVGGYGLSGLGVGLLGLGVVGFPVRTGGDVAIPVQLHFTW